MVKLGFYVVRKHGKRGVGEYEGVCLRFPKEHHSFLRFLKRCQLEVKATQEGNTIHKKIIKYEGLEETTMQVLPSGLTLRKQIL
jgi:hypothetical protein